MRTFFGKFVAFAMFFAFATGSAQAALWSLNYDGLTAAGSTSTDGTAISKGTAFSVHAIFSDTTGVKGEDGFYIYSPSAVNLTVGGTSYSVTAGSIGDYVVGLTDPTSSYRTYSPILYSSASDSGGFEPFYGKTTPALDVAHPSPTAFSQYHFSEFYNYSSMSFSTVGGNLTLGYEAWVGVNTSITAAVPEPEEWAMMLVGSGLISWQLRRRAKAAA
jgi:hypothetical protein